MYSGSYNPYSRYKSRNRDRVLSVLGFIALVILSGAAGYWIGQQESDYEHKAISKENTEYKEQISIYTDEITKLRAEVSTANLRLDEMKNLYENEMGSDEFYSLVSMLRSQIEMGVNVKRLEEVIRTVQPPRNCSEAQSSRAIVKTSEYEGSESVISVADGEIRIFVSGKPAVNQNGKKETWYDPSLPVTVNFEMNGKEDQIKEGVMPLHHSVIYGGKEYRFTISEGAVSYAKVSYDSCDYP